MNKIDFSKIFKQNWIHLLAFGLFILTTFIYFQPQFSGHSLKQHDIVQFKGAANEINHFRETAGEEPLWTNSMFGGMPTYQISTAYEGNLVRKAYEAFKLWMDSPAGMFFLYLIGFYIMLLCMKVDPKVAILGSFAYAFSSYFIIILQAGHNTKAAAIGLAPMVIGAFYMAYRHNFKWGVLLSAFFMGMQVSVNHPQITYYLGILLLFMGVNEFIRYIQSKELGRFAKITGGLIIAYVFALGINYGNLSLTQDYSKYTIRGGNDISINVDGSTNDHNTTSGLDKDYITQWSYGVKESMTFVSPNVYGGASAALANSQFSDLLRSPDMRKDANLVAQNNVYWGDQPFTSGPVYVGIIVFFLAVLAMVYLKGRLKWFLFAAAVLMLMLSWGKNFMGLTDFFIENIPLYNKFRAVTIILSIVELIIPLLAVLFLNELFKNKEAIKENIKPFYITSGAMVAVFAILMFTGLGDGYLNTQESEFLYTYGDQVKAQLAAEDPMVLLENGIDINNPAHIEQVVDQQMKQVNQQFDALVNVRKSIYQSSMQRSILFLVLGIGFITLFLKTNTRKEYVIAGLAVFIVLDLALVDLNYLSSKKSNGRTYDYWTEKEKNDFPLAPTPADKQVLEIETSQNADIKQLVDNVSSSAQRGRSRGNQNEIWSKKFQTLNMATNYRVYEPALGFNNSRASYFHKALNGYHGAKLRRIQNVKDFHIDYNNMDVVNMLNVKYILQGEQVMQNPGALGEVWLVRELNVKETPNDELISLGDLYSINNSSDLALVVNGKVVEAPVLSGRESVMLVDKNDSIAVDIRTMMQFNVGASYVEDINGQRNWIPTHELEKDTLDSFKTLLVVEKSHDFDPANEAIIGSKEAENLSSLTYTGQGSISMSSYAPNAMKYDVNVEDSQFAVFSEMYYPDGWNAYINGEKVDIVRVNYLLRGIELPKGNYELTMKFEVPKYKTANRMSLAGSILLFLLMGGFFVKDFLLTRKETEVLDNSADK